VDRVKLLTKGVVGGKVVLCSGVFVAVGCGLNLHYRVSWILVMLAVMEYAFIARVYYSYSIYSILRGLRAIMSMLAYDILLLMVLVGDINL
jgi:NADH:ubiquinone oxidoreductase subunit H